MLVRGVLASVGLHGVLLVLMHSEPAPPAAVARTVDLQIVTPPRVQPLALGGAAAEPAPPRRRKPRAPAAAPKSASPVVKSPRETAPSDTPPPPAAAASAVSATETAFAASSEAASVTSASAGAVVAAAKPPLSANGGARAGAADSAARLTSPLGLARYYPRQALRDRIEGRTLIEVSVRADGTVAAARVVTSAPAAIFDAAALRVAQQLHFAPARRQDKAVDATTRLELVWRLND